MSTPLVAAGLDPVVTTAPLTAARAGLWRRHVGLSVGVGVLLLVLLAAALAPVLATHDPIANSLRERLKAPSAVHFFGTDDFGRDVWSRVVWGARISLLVASIGVLTVVPVWFYPRSKTLWAAIEFLVARSEPDYRSPPLVRDPRTKDLE